MNRTQSLLSALMLCYAAMAAGEEPDAVAKAAATRVAVGTCATCHGPQGRSTVPKFPVLAGQKAAYLDAQIKAFKAQTRGDPDALGYMWGMSATLDDGLISALADYYARQSPATGSGTSSALIERGKGIYLNGDPSAGIPACAACHGPAALGTDAFPRLAGQHAQYLMKQLASFQSNLRNVAVMHGVAQGLNADQMAAVSTYLESL
jgi:cytochrome c553